MKKVLLLSALALLSQMTWAQFSGSGSGTADDPYLITNADELFDVRNALTATYKLVNDIDLTQFIQEDNPKSGWTPIGTSSKPFKGIFDGNGKCIKGLYINHPEDTGVGFFGVASEASIKSLTFVSPTVIGSSNTGTCIGNAAKGCVIDKVCAINPTVTGTTNVGGILGRAGAVTSPQLSITNNVVSGGQLSGTNLLGGIVGLVAGPSTLYDSGADGDRYVNYTINYNYCSSSISCQQTCGGIIASARGSYVTTSYNYADGYVRPYIIGNQFEGYIESAGVTAGILATLDGTSSLKAQHLGVFNGTYTKTARIMINMSQNLSGGVIYGDNAKGVWNTFKAGSDYTKAAAPTGYMQKVSLSNNIFYGSDLSSISALPYRISTIETGDNFAAATGYTVLYNGEEIDVEDNDYNGTSVGIRQLKRQTTYEGFGYDFSTQWAIVESSSVAYNINQSAPATITNFKSGSNATIEGTATGNGSVYVFINGKMVEGTVKDGAWKVSLGNVATSTLAVISVATESKMASIVAKEYADGVAPTQEEDVDPRFGGGKGTEKSPWLISNADQLYNVNTELSAYFKLTSDIDLTSFIQQDNPSNGWMPIGTSATPFKGHFDGDGHSISGLYINRPNETGVGLFGVTSESTIQNLTLISPTITGGNYTGALIGNAAKGDAVDKVNIVNPTITGTANYVGGLIGRAAAVTSPRLSLTNNVVAGGLVTGANLVGGIIGFASSASILYNNGSGDRYVYYTISNNYASSTLSGTGTVGGIVAQAKGAYNNYTSDVRIHPTVKGNIFEGKIEAANMAGGILGNLDGQISVNSSNRYIAYSQISIDMQQNIAGGIINGNSTCGIWKTYSPGSNYTKANSPTGYMQRLTLQNNVCIADTLSGVAGTPYRISTIDKENNYAAATTLVYQAGSPVTVEDDMYQGISLGLRQLQLKSTYQGMNFDFDSQWAIVDGQTIPYNINQSAPATITNFTSGTNATITGTATGNGKVFVFVGEKMVEGAVVNGAWQANLGIVRSGAHAAVYVATDGKMTSIATKAYADGSAPDPEANETDEIKLSAMYGTYCSTENLDFSNQTDIEAYVAAGYQNGSVLLMRIDYVPAGLGVMLKGTPGTYYVDHTTKTGVYTNLLIGVTAKTQLQQTDGYNTNYILANGSYGIAFYKVAASGGTLAAKKAYLQLPTNAVAGVRAYELRFLDGGETTAIESATTEFNLSNSGTYDLQGRRVANPTKGIYIINGKKILK